MSKRSINLVAKQAEKRDEDSMLFELLVLGYEKHELSIVMKICFQDVRAQQFVNPSLRCAFRVLMQLGPSLPTTPTLTTRSPFPNFLSSPPHLL